MVISTTLSTVFCVQLITVFGGRWRLADASMAVWLY